VRNFRFAGTVTATQVATSLVRMVLALGGARETAAHQLATEDKRKASKACHGAQAAALALAPYVGCELYILDLALAILRKEEA
jgi:hypothetical protein